MSEAARGELVLDRKPSVETSHVGMRFRLVVLFSTFTALFGCYASLVPTFGIADNLKDNLKSSSGVTVQDITDRLVYEI